MLGNIDFGSAVPKNNHPAGIVKTLRVLKEEKHMAENENKEPINALNYTVLHFPLFQ